MGIKNIRWYEHQYAKRYGGIEIKLDDPVNHQNKHLSFSDFYYEK